jgi:DNA primase
MSSVPEEIVERVRAEANIVDVISDYVRLRRAGKNWIGLCPFHDDKKPSLNVEPVKGIYKCFACGKGGNVFTFLMERNGWTFPEAVRNLAESLGLEIPEARGDRREFSERERLAAVVREAGVFYFRTLRSPAGAAALAYFRSRGFSDEAMKDFGLGYSPDSWDATLSHMTGQGYGEEELEKAGLAIKREGKDGWYDRFRGRAMFPIFTATGRVIGFGARRMSEDSSQPKYINSPESPIYQKSRVLYGLYQAKDAIRRSGRAIFVEGYADVISLHDNGVRTAIATSGTAMSREHAELISRYCSRIVLVFDSDKAGEAATERGIDVLLRQGLDISVLRLPDGEDPDTFVRRYGAKEFERRVDESTSFLEFKARQMKLAGDFDAPDRQTAAIRSIVETIALIPDPLKRELFVQRIAADFHVAEPLLFKELERAGRVRNRRPVLHKPMKRSPGEQSVGPDSGTVGPSSEAGIREGEEAGSDDRVTPGQEPAPRTPIVIGELPPAEVGILSVLVHGNPQLLEHVFARVEPDDFAHDLTRQLVAVIQAHYANQRSFTIDDLVVEELPPEIRDLVTMLAVERESISQYWIELDPDLPEPNAWRIARDCLVRIEQEKIDRLSRSVQDKLNDPAISDDERSAALAEFKRLRDRREELMALLAS